MLISLWVSDTIYRIDKKVLALDEVIFYKGANQ